MTAFPIATNDRRIQATAAAAQTVFPYDFPVYADSEVAVYRTRAGVTTTLVLSTDYTVSGVGAQAGGSVTLTAGATLNDVITIVGAMPNARATDFQEQGDFRAEIINLELDRLAIQIQELRNRVDRTLRLQDFDDPQTLSALPDKATRAGKYAGFDANGNPVATAGTLANPLISAFGATLVDDADAATARATLGITLGTAANNVPQLNGSAQLPPVDGSLLTGLLRHGQCRLTKAGANMLLSPFNGNKLVIAGVVQSVPAAGVTLAPTSLSVGTTYFIYAYMNAGTMALEASATGHSTDATTGVEIKTGDATRSLVGMARIVTGPAWADTAKQRFVLSYFNRRGIAGASAFSTARSTGSSSFVELNSEIRVEFLTWADEAVYVLADGRVNQDTANSIVQTGLAFDGTSPEEAYSVFQAYTGGGNGPYALALPRDGLSEGYHYATLLGKNGGSGVASWLVGSNSIGERCNLKVGVRG